MWIAARDRAVGTVSSFLCHCKVRQRGTGMVRKFGERARTAGRLTMRLPA
jgi:hypothetical protein